MSEHIQAAILAMIERAPQWIRQDLTAKDATARIRAEESLAARIADALGKVDPQPE